MLRALPRSMFTEKVYLRDDGRYRSRIWQLVNIGTPPPHEYS